VFGTYEQITQTLLGREQKSVNLPIFDLRWTINAAEFGKSQIVNRKSAAPHLLIAAFSSC
jgi:hypothetical protein